MKDLLQKLDLNAYILAFENFLARKKPLFIQGDSALNFTRLIEFSNYDIKAAKNVANLQDALGRLKLNGILHISEIYEFVKIISYFIYLKKQQIGVKTDEYLQKINIPQNIIDICDYFDNDGQLKESMDERLIALNQAYKNKKNMLNEILHNIVKNKNLSLYLIDFNIHFINDCECLLLRGGFNSVLKGSVMARSSSGYFYVFPSGIEKIKNEQSAILDKKEEIFIEYSKKISKIFSENIKFLTFIDQAFDYIDALLARVFFAKSRDLEFVLPTQDKQIKICEFAHPALNNPKRINIDFSKSVLIITGVNAGGKSMLLKSILTAVFCAKYLLPMSINANQSKIGNFKELFLIIEDPQNVKNDISTFAGRMQSFSKLFSKKNFLLGVDEIELGTDANEAAALYSVLIEDLLQNDAKIIITTHHKALALNLSKNDKVELMAALYDEKNSKPKYEFLSGIIGKSYAFETAQRYNIPVQIIQKAREIHGSENLNEAITKAINLELELKSKIKLTDEKNAKLDNLIQNLKEQKEKANDEINALKSKLEFEYYKAIQEAKNAIKISNTKEQQRSLNNANKLHLSIDKTKLEVVDEIKVGQNVKYSNIKAKVLEIRKNEAYIDADGIKMRVPLNALKITQNSSTQNQNLQKINVQAPQSASMIIDLHGLRSQEAIEKLDKFISDALLAGFDEILIKHGIGTGKLAFAVKEFLKAHPSVVSFRDGTPNEGGFGSKVVKL